MIKISYLNKYYNRKSDNEIHVINDVTLELPDKGLVVLFGQSGSGKTTLLNAIGGLDSVDSGTIDINGEKFDKYDCNRWDALRNRDIGYVFQSYNLVEDMTVFENLDVALKLAGIADPKERSKRIMHTLDALGIAKYKKRRPSTLSGGQQQRVAIARAICKNPKIVIADEPTGNLDDKNTVAVMDLIKQISRFCLVVLVTHEPKLVMYYADETINIVDGKAVDRKVSSGAKNLTVKDNTTIYLKDMQKTANVTENGIELNCYSDDGSPCDIKLNVVKREGKFYVELINNTSAKVSLVNGDSEIVLKDEHYVARESTGDQPDIIDLNILKPVENPVSVPIIKTSEAIKSGFMRLFGKTSKSRRRRKRLGLFGFIVASILLCVSAAMIGRVFYLEPWQYVSTDQNFYVGEVKVGDYSGEKIVALEDRDDIKIVWPNLPVENMFRVSAPSFLQSSTDVFITNLDYSIVPLELLDNPTVLYGKLPSAENEVAVSKTIWEYINKSSNNLQYFCFSDVSQLVGRNCNILNSGDFLITAVVDTESPSVYIPQANYFYNVLTANSSSGSVPSESLMALYATDKTQFVKKAKIYLLDNMFDLMSDDSLAEIYVYAENANAVKTSSDLNLENYRNTEKSELLNEKLKAASTVFVITAVLLAVALVSIYYMMRSSMFTRIKEIGILRSIGANKRAIYKMFFYETCAIIISSTLIGIILGSALCFALNDSVLGDNMMYYNALSVVCVAIVAIGSNLLFGMLPVISLLKKTPAEILSKYDI